MSTQTLKLDSFGYADFDNQSRVDFTSKAITLASSKSSIYCKLSKKANVSWGFKKITRISARVYVKEVPDGRTASLTIGTATNPFDVKTLKYSNAPGFGSPMAYTPGATSAGYATCVLVEDPFGAERRFFDCGIAVSSYESPTVYTPAGTFPPALLIEVDESTTVRMDAYSWPGTWGGETISKSVAEDIIFGFFTQPDGLCYEPLTQVGVSAIWRAVGSTEEHELQMPDGTAKKITIPANTFAGLRSAQVRVKVYGSNGLSKTTDQWCTILLSDSVPYAYPLSPSGEMVDCSESITFRWKHQISSGSAQTKAELQWSTDKSTWTALTTITGAVQSWTAPANTFTAGTRYWRVRTYNSDNVASAWSDAATFICVGAPAAPVVVIQELSPRPRISWQVEGQQAYQVELVGVYADGTRFGTDKQWQSPLYLADGDYTVRVRVQNEYGFWSAWGVAPLQIINTPGSAITLTAEAGREVTLAWAASGFDYYIVYRNGAAIARTTETSYVDRTSIGQVEYQVRGCYASSANYSLSDAVTVTVSTPSVCLYDLDAGQWVDLRYDASAHRSTAYSLARDIQYMQLSGRAYPVAERSEFVQRSLRIACVCFTAADRARMLSMLGHLVCVKTPEGNMVMGYIANLSETSDDFFSTYGFDVAQADIKEEIDIDEA